MQMKSISKKLHCIEAYIHPSDITGAQCSWLEFCWTKHPEQLPMLSSDLTLAVITCDHSRS